jgi:hypothetical protein
VSRQGGDHRGNATSRRRRKRWMLAAFGDGITAPCVHCGAALTYDTIEADRIIPGGPYARYNVQPSCRACNARRGDSPITPFPVRSTA